MRQKDEDRIAELAEGQHGVVTRQQLLRLGLSSRQVQTRLERGGLRRIHQGVYLLGPLRGRLRPDHALEMAAVLACGPGTLVSHRHAAGLWGILPAPTRGPVHVLTPGRTPARRPGIRAHRAGALAPDDAAALDGIPVTSAPRTLCDLAAVVGTRELERAVARAERNGWVDAAELRGRIGRLRRSPGAPRLREAALGDGGPALTRSEAESRFLDLVRGSGLARPETNVVIHGREVDFLWRRERVVVEVDGFAYHGSRRSFAADRRRDAELLAEGLQVMRVTWEQIVRHPLPTIATLARALGRAGGQAGA